MYCLVFLFRQRSNDRFAYVQDCVGLCSSASLTSLNAAFYHLQGFQPDLQPLQWRSTIYKRSDLTSLSQILCKSTAILLYRYEENIKNLLNRFFLSHILYQLILKSDYVEQIVSFSTIFVKIMNDYQLSVYAAVRAHSKQSNNHK